MKKVLFILFLTFFLCFPVCAGDLPEAIVTLSDIDVFIGEITEITGGTVKIDVEYALFNCYDVDTITLDEFEYMTADDKHRKPGVGDYAAVAAEYKGDKWLIAFGDGEHAGLASKSDGLNPETLKLYSGGNAFIERMNCYINDGTYSYEKRKELLSPADMSEQNQPQPDNEKISESDTNAARIAKETEIVLPPPVVEKTVQSTNTISYWYNKPYVKYPFITLLSALASFFITRRIACRIEGKHR